MVQSKSLFVTVGTTQFDDLIDAVTSEVALEWLISENYTHVILQYGKGRAPVIPNEKQYESSVVIESYDFKASLEEDMRKAHLIVSHAGAGTVMEALYLNKYLVVVINAALMNNHQKELALALGSRNHLFVVNHPNLLRSSETWQCLQDFSPTPYIYGDEHEFPTLLDDFLGFPTKKQS